MTAAELDIIIGANTDQAIAAFKKLGYSITQTEQKAAKASGKMGKDFTGLSRVIQDLPFGFIAISNNLQQLLPAAGAAGLAFSAITTAISFAQIGLQNWVRKGKEAKEETNKFAESLNAAKAGAIETGVKLQAFVNIAKDNTKSLSERNYALDQANKLMGEHGEKLTLANVATKEITEQTQKFTQALIAEAVASKYSDKIADLIIKQAEASKAYGDALDKYNKAVKTAADNNKQTNKDDQEDFYNIVKKNDAFSLLVQSATNYKGITKDLTETNTLFNETIQKSVSLFGEIGTKTDGAKNNVKDFYDEWKKQMMKLNTQGIVLGSFQQEVQKLVGNQGQLTIRPSVTVAPVFSPETQKKFDELLALASNMVDSFAIGIGEALGNALSGKGDFFGGFLKLIGNAITDIGKYVITASALLSKVKVALAAALEGTPAFGIAVGVGLIALGTVLKNIPKFATGGVVTSPTLALVGEQGPERITPLGYEQSAHIGFPDTIVLGIRGNDLYTVLKRTENGRYYTT